MGCLCGHRSETRCRLFVYGPADATAIPKPHHLLPRLNPDCSYMFCFYISENSGFTLLTVYLYFVFFYLAAFKRHYALRLAIAPEFFYCSYIAYFMCVLWVAEIKYVCICMYLLPYVWMHVFVILLVGCGGSIWWLCQCCFVRNNTTTSTTTHV